MRHYSINIFYSLEDRGYIADIPEMKYCSAFGATPEEALREVQLAKSAWLKVAKDKKAEIRKLEIRHRAGYAKLPVVKGEFDV